MISIDCLTLLKVAMADLREVVGGHGSERPPGRAAGGELHRSACQHHPEEEPAHQRQRDVVLASQESPKAIVSNKELRDEVVIPLATGRCPGQTILVLLGRPVLLFQEARCPTESA